LSSKRSRTFYVRTCGATLITAAVSLSIAGLSGADATAATNHHSANGDNGTVKVHRSTTSADDPRNEPHVCGFYLVGFQFDAGQQVSWQIVSWPPTGNRTEVLHGTLTLDQNGQGRTNDLKLSNGHYKLYWNFNGENGKAKQKVFWVKCGPGKPTMPPTGTPEPTIPPTGAPQPTATPSPIPSTQSPAPVPTPVPSDLPVTG
jgi:hypothetical protein